MNFHRTLKKIKSNMLSLFLAIAVSFIIIPIITTPLQIYADGSMTDQDGFGSRKIVGGPTSDRTGWLFYMIDANNNQVTDTKAVACSPICDRNGTPLPAGNVRLVSRYGREAAGHSIGVPAWGKPFDSSGHGRGSEVKQWLLANNNEKAIEIISEDLGEEHVDKWLAKEEYLVFEPFYWHHVYLNGIGTGIWLCLTDLGWGFFQQSMGFPEYGDPKLSSYTNGVYAFCVKLEDCQEIRDLGYTAPTAGKQTNAEMATRNRGCGIGIVWSGGVYQTTCDEPLQPAPHPAPLESQGKTQIVKNYRTLLPDNTYTEDGCHARTNVSNKIIIEEEEEYKVVGWVTTNATTSPIDSINWNPPGVHIQEGKTSDDTVTLNPKTEKTLYVLLERKETEPEDLEKANYTITQSQITRGIRLSKPDAWLSMEKIQEFEFTWKSPKHKTKCDGHDYKTGDKVPELDPDTGDETGNLVDETDTAYCTWGKWVDQDVIFALDNSEKMNYPSVLSTKDGWNKTVTSSSPSNISETEWPRIRTIVEATKFKKTDWDNVCVIHRGKDKLTVAEWKNSALGFSANEDLPDISPDNYTVSNSCAGTRLKEDYNDKFTAVIVDDSPDVTTERDITADSGHGDCDSDQQEFTLAKELTIDVKVLVEVYSGAAEEGVNDVSVDTGKMLTIGSGSDTIKSGVMRAHGGAVSFRPYIRMQYSNYGETEDTPNPAMVLSEYQRMMTPNDYAEIIWSKGSGNERLRLSSLQWSTHAQAVADHGTGDVLPGGATMNLGIKKDERQEITLVTYQPVVIGAGQVQIDTAGGTYDNFTEDVAISNHESYVMSVEDGLEYLNVQQWVSTNDSSGGNVWDTGIKVNPGCDISSLGANPTASTEDKYYFRGEGELTPNDGSNGGEGDLDVENLGTKTKYYTFFTNTSGELRMVVDNPDAPLTDPTAGEFICKKSSPSVSGIAKEINDRTYVVKKLLAAVEMETGSDAKAEWNPAWYNEAFDGITIMVQTTKLKVGYLRPYERSAVLDPRLTPKSKGQSQLFTKYNASQFKMNSYSGAYSDNEYQIGYFVDREVYMKDMDYLYTSMKFYIPNVTTQDLH